MPHISLNVYAGKSKETLEEMAKRLQASLLGEPWNLKPTDISVSVASYPGEDFRAEVKEKTKADTLLIASDYID